MTGILVIDTRPILDYFTTSALLEALKAEAQELKGAEEGHAAAVEAAASEAQDAARVLQDRESAFGQLTEDVARLAARHQSAERLLQDAETTLKRSEEAEVKAGEDAKAARADLVTAEARKPTHGQAGLPPMARSRPCRPRWRRLRNWSTVTPLKVARSWTC